MNDKDQYLVNLLQKIMLRLSAPLTVEEKACGWNEGAKKTWLKIFEERFLTKLETGQFRENQEEEVNLTYWLGYDDLIKGELADLISEFGRQWNNKYAKKPAWWWTNPKRRKDWPWW